MERGRAQAPPSAGRWYMYMGRWEIVAVNMTKIHHSLYAVNVTMNSTLRTQTVSNSGSDTLTRD